MFGMFNNFRIGAMTDVVEAKSGNTYYVDTANTVDAGPETMVFLYDPTVQKVKSWHDLYARWYFNMEDAYKGHKEIVASIDELEPEFDFEEELEEELV